MQINGNAIRKKKNTIVFAMVLRLFLVDCDDCLDEVITRDL